MRVPTQLDNPRMLRALREGGNMINDSLYITPDQVEGGCCMYRGGGNKWIQFTQAYRAKHGNTPLRIMAKAYKRGAGNDFVAQGLRGGAYDEQGLPIASPIEAPMAKKATKAPKAKKEPKEQKAPRKAPKEQKAPRKAPKEQKAPMARAPKAKKEPKEQKAPRMTKLQKEFALSRPDLTPKEALELYRANKKAISDEQKRLRAERSGMKPRYPKMDTACDYRARAVQLGIPVSALYRDGRRTVKGKPNVLVKIPIKRSEIKDLIDEKEAELSGHITVLEQLEAKYPDESEQAPKKKRGRRPRVADVITPSPMYQEAMRTVGEKSPESKKELTAWLKARKIKPATFGYKVPLSKLNRAELRNMFLNTNVGSGFQKFPSNTTLDVPYRANSTIWI